MPGVAGLPGWSTYVVRLYNPEHKFPEQEYTGATGNLKQRIADHNAAKSNHTAKFAPWRLIFYAAFLNKYKALEFEKYLKSHSGREFAKKRLLDNESKDHKSTS